MAKTMLEEAMEDAKLLKETAIENAKNVLVEALSPKIKEFMDSQMGESPMYEEPADKEDDAMPMGMDDAMGGDHEDEEQDEEMLARLLPKMLKKLGVEVPGEVEEVAVNEEDVAMESNGMDEAHGVDEAKDEMDEAKEVDEMVEVTTEDLKVALSEVLSDMKLKTEATVTKGFGDAQDATPKSAGGAGAKGIADEKSGEHHWKDEEPPHAQDWTVKEAAYKKKIALFEKAHASLTTENAKYKKVCAFLTRNLQEVNLFNSKLLYTNKLLHSAKLNNEQRRTVIEAFDSAHNLREVELVYKSLSESLKIAGVLGESKQPQRPSSLKGPKGSRVAFPGATVLQESANQNNNDFTARMQELAGLVD